MQHNTKQQEQQTCILREDRLPLIDEITALRSLAEVVGVAGHLLTEIDDFKLWVERLDVSAWERKEVKNFSCNELAHLSLAVLRAYNAQSN